MVDMKKLRESKGLTQESLAKQVNVTRQAIGNIETGANKPSVDIAKKLAFILEVDWTEFFDD